MTSIHLGVTQFVSNMQKCIYQGKFPSTYTTSSLGARFVEQIQDNIDNENKPMAIVCSIAAIAFTFFETFSQLLGHGQSSIYHITQLEFSKVFTDGKRAMSDVISNGLFVAYGLALTVLGIVDLSKLDLLKAASFESDKVKISQLKHTIKVQNTEISDLKKKVKGLKKEIEEN